VYISETQKIRPKIEKYLFGEVADIGCGHDPVVPNAFGIDCRSFPHVKLLTKRLDQLSVENPALVERFDVVYSSHCLEHFSNDVDAINDWCKLIKRDGFLILYLPDDRYYRNDLNPEHLHRYYYHDFMREFMPRFQFLHILDSGEDIGDDRYSFFVVAKKIASN